ncbi:MAG: substrate-binding domain-containing protein [Pseudomonadota bacterium]
MIRWLCVLLMMATSAGAETLRLAVTTSFANSGLADVLLPEIAEDTGIEVQLLVVGTGQALRLGAAGDVEAVLVHARAAEEQFVADGHAPYRREIMYNDFVIVGPGVDPAGVGGAPVAVDAFRAVAEAEVDFVSRGDASGTHQAERRLWAAAGVEPEGVWYKETGSGMGAALNTAAELGAYTLTDRATWLSFGNRRGLALLFEGDPALFNQYAYLPVRGEAALVLEGWLTSARARALIDGYRIGGEQLFTFNAEPLQ